MHLLIIDNYDSFTYNLYQLLGDILSREKTFVLDVIRNDELTHDEIKKRDYDRIVISPGSGNPDEQKYFGVCGDVITQIGTQTPVLGVCLGMQGIVHFFGGTIIRAKKPMHGKTSSITHDGKGIFKNLPQHLEVMRYHSLIAEQTSLPACLQITARTESDNEIMGVRHKKYPIEGIQFHPESFATEGGMKILENFLQHDY